MRCSTGSDPPARRPRPAPNAGMYKTGLEAALKCRTVLHARAIKAEAAKGEAVRAASSQVQEAASSQVQEASQKTASKGNYSDIHLSWCVEKYNLYTYSDMVHELCQESYALLSGIIEMQLLREHQKD